MKLKLRDHTYIDWRVYSIIKIKGKYGFRVKLIYGVDDEEIKQHAGFRTKKEADDKRNDVITQLKNHTYVVYPRVKVADFYEYWLDKLEKSDIAYNTYISYRNAVSNYIVKKYGKILMTTLNMGHIQKLYNTVSQEHESVVRIVKTVMNISLEFAKRNNIVSVNVALNVNLPKTVKKKPYRKLNIDVSKTLTIEQAKALINESKNTPIYLQILFAILMGFRISEINSLRYDDVDFINRKLDLKEQLGRTKESSDKYKKKTVTKQRIKLKTKSSMRQNEIPDLLFEAILEQRKIYEKNKRRRINDKNYPFIDENYICCSTYGHSRSRGFHTKYFNKLKQDLNLPNIEFHDLRHTYATLLAKAGFSVKAISTLLGHSTEIVTADVYIDTQTVIYDCLEILEPYIESVIPPQQDYIVYDYTNINVDLDSYYDELMK